MTVNNNMTVTHVLQALNGQPVAKPQTTKSMLVSYFFAGGKRQNMILPLCDVSITHGDGWTTFKINFPRNKVAEMPQRVERLVWCVSDDPYQTWAGDWSHLGTMRIRIELNRLVCILDSMLVFRCGEIDCQTEFGDLIIPDRKVK